MHNLKFLSLVMKAFGTLITWKSGLNIPLWFGGTEDLWSSFFFHLFPMKVARGWGKGDHAHILGRGIHGQQPLSSLIPMLFYSWFQCCKLRWWKKFVRINDTMACAKKGDTNVLQLEGCNEAKMRPNFLRVIYNYHLQKK